MKGYSGWEIHATEVINDSKTFQKWVWFYIEGIAMLVPKIVSKVLNFGKLTINIDIASVFNSVQLQLCFDSIMMDGTDER